MNFQFFNSFINFFLGLSQLFNPQSYSAAPQDVCFDSIKKLSLNDKCLYSRVFQKLDAAKQTSSSLEFKNSLANSNQKCNGTFYSCGNTMSWVTEVFEGAESQYGEYKGGFTGASAGYKQYYGDDLRNLFKQNKTSTNMIVYHLRHYGTEDHVWTIEQRPNQGGYRIYQSYNDGYSNRAWISDSLNGLFHPTTGEIMIFNKLKAQVNQIIQGLSGGKLNITSDIQSIQAIAPAFTPFVIYVRDYNEATAVSNFARAWNKYGKGKLIQWTEFEKYVDLLASMVSYFRQYATSDTPFSEKVYNDWIDLFGSPNPVHYPNLPSNAILNFILPNIQYGFEAKAEVIQNPDSNCNENYNVFLKYL